MLELAEAAGAQENDVLVVGDAAHSISAGCKAQGYAVRPSMPRLPPGFD